MIGIISLFVSSVGAGGFELYVNVSDKERKLITLDPHKVMLYIDVHKSYPCPYYSDRAVLYVPETNRLAQMLRSFGSKIIFNTDKLRSPTVTKEELPDYPIHLDETSPGVSSKCLYDGFNKNPAPDDKSIHPEILYSNTSDLFAKDYKDAVRLAIDNGATHVIATGVHCNMWVPPMFELLKQHGIQPIYIYDISDVMYLRETQIEHFDTHNKALSHFWKWVMQRYGMILEHWWVIDRPLNPKPEGKKIRFDGNRGAYFFYEYFGLTEGDVNNN